MPSTYGLARQNEVNKDKEDLSTFYSGATQEKYNVASIHVLSTSILAKSYCLRKNFTGYPFFNLCKYIACLYIEINN